jgi:hypothetical protein
MELATSLGQVDVEQGSMGVPEGTAKGMAMARPLPLGSG